MNVLHRLNELITEKQLTVYSFERECGITQNVIQKALKNNTSFQVVVIEKITEKFPELNVDWLFNGRGNMFIDGMHQTQTLNENRPNLYPDLSAENEKLEKELFACLRENKMLQKKLEAGNSIGSKS